MHADDPYSPDVAKMSAYCTYCPKLCRFSCPTAAAESRETVTPWAMMRLLELTADRSVALTPEVAEAFHHCTGCRRCQTFCRHTNDVPRALWQARERAAAADLIPAAYRPLREAFETQGRPRAAAITWRPAPGVFDADSPVGFWPDCDTLAHHPELIDRVGRLLERVLGQKVRLVAAGPDALPVCCGFPLGATGDRPGLDRHLARRWPDLEGLDTLYTDCPALSAWAEPTSSWPELAHDEPERLRPHHVIELLARRLPELPPEEPLDLSQLMVHPSCMMTRQARLHADVLRVLRAAGHGEPVAMIFDQEEAECCGGQATYRALEAEAAERQAARVAERLHTHPEATRLVSTAATCQCAMSQARPELDICTLLDLVCQAYRL
ncbi:hypothetical protein DL240_17590 [Lujinxingia litoralis]|uniref:4Fe-4S ferredoxin-type domain-containing protein n=1 Tax=Lujinxingia litoralis TaxID=2211119 RepID=A0A328C1U2_9DELT|nr:(Fe-S)-binding protein [Lujinxingia litoralis]RAL20393.1 hypothetical protein DL240_17590 [Lujinxingia litoralis]